MSATSNLGLTLPAGSDYADVAVLNDNWTKIDEAVAKKAELGADGKIPPEQLPEMKFDPSGSAAAVQKNLDAHTGNRNNPHAVTAAQVGAATTTDLSAHTGNRSNPHSVTAQQVGADPAGTAAAVQQALASQIAALTTQMGGKVSFQTGTYKGTSSSRHTLTLPVSPKVLIIMAQYKEDEEITPLVAIGPGYYLISSSSMSGSVPAICEVSEFGSSVEIYCGKTYRQAFNQSGVTYTWVALY